MPKSIIVYPENFNIDDIMNQIKKYILSNNTSKTFEINITPIKRGDKKYI